MDSDRDRAVVSTERRRNATPWAYALAWVVLLVGLIASTAGAFMWARTLRTYAATQFEGDVDGVAAVLSSELTKDQTLVAAIRGFLTAFPDATNTDFESWYRASEAEARFSGGVGTTYIEKVPAADLDAFVAEVQADPVSGLAPPVPYRLVPDTDEEYYCLGRIGVWKSDSFRGSLIPPGLNYCSDRIPGVDVGSLSGTISQATETGDLAVLSGGSFGADFFGIFAAVYADGVVPPTVEEREQAVRGWVGSSFDSELMIAAALEGTSNLGVEVFYAGPSGREVLIGSGGNPPEDATTTETIHLATDEAWLVRVTGTPVVAGLSPFVQGIAVFLGGAVVSCLLFAFIRILAGSRARALDLVDLKTEELAHRALHDALTDLPNRTLLMDRAGVMLVRAQHDANPVAAFFVDIDGFKSINDTLGHATGDELLKAVASRIRGAVRDSDTVGRLGGDEFVVLVEGEALRAGPEPIAERMLEVMREPFRIGGVQTSITVSIGVAVAPRDSADELIGDADVAMYVAKTTGKNRFKVFDTDIGESVAEHLSLEWDLHSAVNENQLFLQYQPTLDLRTETIVGVEALVRWRHPERGVLQPDSFIHLAEDSGLIVPIGRWVLREACEQAATWQEAGYRMRMNVNVAGHQLNQPGFLQDVRDTLAASGADPSLLMLEITESCLTRDTSMVITQLDALKSLGVEIAIDDFGTGYSSMAYLQQFPVDALKIGRVFVSRIMDSAESDALIRTLVQLGKSMGMETFAEGIEEWEQLDLLRRDDCDTGQGFLFSEPLDADACTAYILSRDTVKGPSVIEHA